MEVLAQVSEEPLASIVSSHNEQTSSGLDGTNCEMKSGFTARSSFSGSKSVFEKNGHAEDGRKAKFMERPKSNIIRRVSRSFRGKNRRKSEPNLPVKTDNGETTGPIEETEQDREVGSSDSEKYSGSWLARLTQINEMEVLAQVSEEPLASIVSSHNEQTSSGLDGTNCEMKSGFTARSSFSGSKSAFEKNGHAEDGRKAKFMERPKSNIIRRASRSFRVKSRRKSDPNLPVKTDNGETTGPIEETEQDCEVGSSDSEKYSAMQVNELIIHGKVQEAYSIIQTMEKELLEEGRPEDSSSCSDHDNRVKDMEYLYKYLMEKIKSVIKDTLEKEANDEELLTSVVNVISAEAGHRTRHQQMNRPHSGPLGSPRKWKDVWKDTVEESVRERINSVSLPSEENACLSVHLTHVTKLIVQDLLKVKRSVKACYTEDFAVCDTYMTEFHRMVSRHIIDSLLSRNLEFKDVYSVLAWVTKTYSSESLMGNPELKPEFNTAILGPLLDADVLDELQSDYLKSLKVTIEKYMEKYRQIQKENWYSEKEPDIDILDGIYTSELYIDIQEMIEQHVRESGNISEYLQNETLRICLVEVAQFIPRLVEEFTCWDQTKPSPFFMKYFVTYINEFCGIRSKLNTTNTTESQDLERIITLSTENLKEYFFKKLEQQTQPQFQKLLTRNWMSSNEVLYKLNKEVSILLEDLQHLGLPYVTNFLIGVHKYLIKEYISQIMKQRLRLNRTNRGEAANKMRREGELINSKFTELGSESHWLCPAIPLISEVVGVKEEDSMKIHLALLVSTYPDLRREHVSAILYLQGTGRRKKKSILHYFKELRNDASVPHPDADRSLFPTIEQPNQVQCFPILIKNKGH